MARGKRGSLTAVRGGPVLRSAHGVRRVGPVKISEESIETEKMDWETREFRSADRSGPVLLSAHGVGRDGPI
jgi:hypothetical protein